MEQRKHSDLSPYWPKSEFPFGFMTSLNNGGIPNHGYTHWWTMFNPRQLLVHAQLLKAIETAGNFSWDTREYVSGCISEFFAQPIDVFLLAYEVGQTCAGDVQQQFSPEIKRS